MARKRNVLRERARLEAAAALGVVMVDTVFACRCGQEWVVPWLDSYRHCPRCNELNMGAQMLHRHSMEPEDD